MRAHLVLALSLLALVPPTIAISDPEPVVIAIIDTGIRPTHHAFAPGQIVAWYDFSNKEPRSNQTPWDPLVPTPYDLLGHGTAVASMAAGLAGLGLTPNFAPGTRLAIANVYNSATGGLPRADTAEATRWAVDVAGADVIIITAASYLETEMTASHWALIESIQYARAKGVLAVVPVGNGALDVGLIPDTSWEANRGLISYSLLVGGARGHEQVVGCTGRYAFGLEVCGPYYPVGLPAGAVKDPEVTSDYVVTAACFQDDACKWNPAGTSVSAPRAASLAAHFIAHARQEGRTLGADGLEWLIKQSAFTNSPYPPTLEGYGYLDEGAAARGEAILDGAPGPSGTNWDLRVEYVEHINAAESDLVS